MRFIAIHRVVEGSALCGLPHVASIMVEMLSPSSIDRAAELGLLRVLTEHRGLEATTHAMDSAAAYGHLDVLKWLHANRYEGCTESAIVQALANGHVDVSVWLVNVRGIKPSAENLLTVMRGGRFDFMPWILAKGLLPIEDTQCLEMMVNAESFNIGNVGPTLAVLVEQGHERGLRYLLYGQTKISISTVPESLIWFTVGRGYVDWTSSIIVKHRAPISLQLLQSVVCSPNPNDAMVSLLASRCDKKILFKVIQAVAIPQPPRAVGDHTISLLVAQSPMDDAGLTLVQAVLANRMDIVLLFQHRASVEMKAIALEMALQGRASIVAANMVYADLLKDCDDALMEAAALNLQEVMRRIAPECSEGAKFRASLVAARLPALDSPAALLKKRLRDVRALLR
jgi:hypothetical protein